MGRSVSTHKNAIDTVFIHLEQEVGEDIDFEWECFTDDLREVITSKYPSLSECDRWAGREDHVILENEHCEVSVSEYCGVVAVCLAPRESRYGDPERWHVAWCERIANNFHKVVTRAFNSSAMEPMGTFSNGETVYRKL